MATDTLSGLEDLLTRLEVSKLSPMAAGADVLHNPIDIYRCQLAETLVGLVHSEPKVAFDAIQTSNEVTNGDLVITLPRLKLQNNSGDFTDVGFGLIQQVRHGHGPTSRNTSVGIRLPLLAFHAS